MDMHTNKTNSITYKHTNVVESLQVSETQSVATGQAMLHVCVVYIYIYIMCVYMYGGIFGSVKFSFYF